MRVTIATLLMLAVTPAAAQTAQAGAVPAPAAKPADKQICRREQMTGTIMPAKRICHTALEWRQIDEANTTAIGAYRNRPGDNGMGQGN